MDWATNDIETNHINQCAFLFLLESRTTKLSLKSGSLHIFIWCIFRRTFIISAHLIRVFYMMGDFLFFIVIIYLYMCLSSSFTHNLICRLKNGGTEGLAFLATKVSCSLSCLLQNKCNSEILHNKFVPIITIQDFGTFYQYFCYLLVNLFLSITLLRA